MPVSEVVDLLQAIGGRLHSFWWLDRRCCPDRHYCYCWCIDLQSVADADLLAPDPAAANVNFYRHRKRTTVVDPDKFEKDNKAIHSHLLNHVNDFLFDLFVIPKSAMIIWDTLESIYRGDDAGRKKYDIGKWLQFQMSDDKSIMD